MSWNYVILLVCVLVLPLYGWWRRQPVHWQIAGGFQESGKILLRITPYVCGMLIAISMLRASGCFELLTAWLAPVLHRLGIPVDIVPLALLRPFSGSASNAMFAEIVHTHGGNAFVSHVAATMLGSTETTFYVLAVYFGAVGIKKYRYALWAGLLADTAGIIASILICHMLFHQ